MRIAEKVQKFDSTYSALQLLKAARKYYFQIDLMNNKTGIMPVYLALVCA